MELSEATGPNLPPLLEETIGANLTRTVARFGDRAASVECATGRRWTYREFDAAVNRVAGGLLAAGLTKGDRLGVWAPNCAEWTLTQYATARLGIILVNINPAYRTHELSYAINQSGLRMLVCATCSRPATIRRWSRRSVATARVWRRWPSSAGRAGRNCWTPAPTSTTGCWPRSRAICGWKTRSTSSTLGHHRIPQGATLSHRNIVNNGYFVTETIGFTELDRLVIPVPFYHCFGMVMGNLGCTTHGATMIIPGPTFEPEAALRAVQTERATALYGVPTMFIAEQNLDTFGDFDLSTLRTGIMALAVSG